MKSVFAVLALLLIPTHASAELTADLFQKFRAEARAFSPPPDTNTVAGQRAHVERVIAAELEHTYPGDFAPAVLSDAFRWRMACQKGDLAACTSLGQLYADGDHVWSDTELAAQIFWLACSDGHGPACHAYDRVALNSSLEYALDYPALSFHESGCAEGDERSCKALYSYHLARDRDLATDYGNQACAIDPGLFICTLIMTKEERLARREGIIARAQSNCEAGDVDACFRLGKLTKREDPTLAVSSYNRACDLGNANGCSSAAWMHQNSKDLPKNVTAAKDLLARACDQDAQHCHALADLIVKDSDANITTATALYQRACNNAEDKHSDPSCLTLKAQKTDLLKPALLDLIAPDLRATAETAQAACASGDGPACRTIASHLKSQTKTTLHDAMATKALRRACDLNDAQACFEVETRDYKPGINHGWDVACAGGYDTACIAVLGAGDPENWQSGLEGMCQDGNGAACTRLGTLHLHGTDHTGRPDVFPTDMDAAFAALQNACAAGDAEGCGRAAWMIDPTLNSEDRKHLKSTVEEAIALHQKSCDMGWGWACFAIISHLPEDQHLAYAIDACEKGECTYLPSYRLQHEHRARMAGQDILTAATDPHYEVFVDQYHGAVRRLGRACARDHAWACHELGKLYSGFGDGYELRHRSFYPETGVGLMSHACKLGSPSACQDAAESMPNDTAEEVAQQLATMDDHCKDGAVWACRHLAYHHRRDDQAKYVQYLFAAVRLGDTDFRNDLWWAVQSRSEADIKVAGALVCAWGGGYQCMELTKDHLSDRPELARIALSYGCEDGDSDSCRALRRMN